MLKVGIISDVQGYAFPEDWGMHNCEKAIKFLAEKEIDVLLMAGDLADHGDDATPLEYYQEMLKRHFGEKMPVQVNCAGNHDFWSHKGVSYRTPEEIYETFCRIAGDEVADPIRKTVGGYDFIAFSTNNDASYTEEDCEKLLRPAIEDAVRRDPAKPIFIVTHFHPEHTVTGSISSGRAGLRKVMNDYPQVVSFSGHTHCPLEDERCIWQGEFTAINTSGLSYGCIEDKCENLTGPILPFAREAVQFMYMEIHDDRLEIQRFNAEDGHRIGQWDVPMPYDPAKPVYTFEQRRQSRTAPEFPENTILYFRIDYGFTYLVFDSAKAHFYRLVITEDGGAAAPMEYQYIAPDFYRLVRNKDPRLIFKLPPHTIEAGKWYTFEMYPVDTFGAAGKPISVHVQIPPHYTIQNDNVPGPQE